jgi:hypothetical protein
MNISSQSISPIPYIKTKPTKPYTLILDLDETLIHLNLVRISFKSEQGDLDRNGQI